MPRGGDNKPWIQPAADVGDLDGWSEAPLKEPQEVIAALLEEQGRRDIGPKHQGVETD